MVEFDLPKQKSSIIKVIGVGGGGSNAVNYMYSHDIEGVDFIICNTDAKALEQSQVPNKIQLGPYLTQGLGAGADPEVGKNAAEESIEEIKRILEVNTKMAFITAGMGGGTGTGGAPIMARICKEMGILTVGIVTTPFAFEGPRRRQQAEAGIKELEPYVDTLLVISNDKLRMQYGNLKARAAFSKADDVLATAAKCITDIINSRGHIIVDFADVCTVMKNGGVAILGSAEASGEDRAMQAIENALNSPLLNDNDIRDAKWILLNVNSQEGDCECSMDEIEIISEHVRNQSGAHANVIFGMGYDEKLNDKIAITLIATGFQNKSPFGPLDAQHTQAVQQPAAPQKLTLTLEMDAAQAAQPVAAARPAEPVQDPMAPRLSEPGMQPYQQPYVQPAEPVRQPAYSSQPLQTPQPASFLAKPATVYAQAPQPQAAPVAMQQPQSELPELTLVIKENAPQQASPLPGTQPLGYGHMGDEEDEQVRKAKERIARLRQISFNVNGNDANNEFETVPAYVRKKMDLSGHSSLGTTDQLYGRYAVPKDDEHNAAPISTINSFLEGKKPD